MRFYRSYRGNNDVFAIVLVALFVMLWIAAIIGWILNIIAIALSSADTLTTLIVLRIIGIFVVPLGSVLGLFVG